MAEKRRIRKRDGRGWNEEEVEEGLGSGRGGDPGEEEEEEGWQG